MPQPRHLRCTQIQGRALLKTPAAVSELEVIVRVDYRWRPDMLAFLDDCCD
jgi:hypothetical protein